MHVVATAGHVDHGKSTLIRALTGSDPDRLAEEKRRGLTIELGFAWASFGAAGDVAFVDVPGHQKFLATTLAGLGPTPAVLFVVAADEGWSRQSGEHLAALDALNVGHGLVVVTKSDRADPGPATAQATARVAGTSLAGSPSVAVSATTGAGLDELRSAVEQLAVGLPPPKAPARQRIWIDRSFTITGTGTVVTGTLGAGRVARGDGLELNGQHVTVRALESLGLPRDEVTGTARVAIALRGVEKSTIARGDALLSRGLWAATQTLDARLTRAVDSLPRQLVLHVGTAAVPVTQRALSPTHVRLTLTTPLPLTPGDRALLRDPGAQHVASGVVVLDVDPPAFTRRGDAARRAQELAARGDIPDPVAEIARRPFVRVETLARLGVASQTAAGARLVDGRLVTDAHWQALRAELAAAVERVPTGVAAETLRGRLGLPSPAVLHALVEASPGLRQTEAGRVMNDETPAVPGQLADAAGRLAKRWAADPLDAPAAEELIDLGLDGRALGVLQSLGLLVRLSDTVAVGPAAAEAARVVLSKIEAPFTAGEARTALGSSRRVVLPLLGYLDSHRVTVRGADDRRRLR